MQDFPAKNFSSADSKEPEEFGELEEILEWEDGIDLNEIKSDDKISAPPAEKRAHPSKEKFDIREDVSQDFFALKPSKKKGGLLQAATKLRNIPGFDASEQEEELTLNFSTAVPNISEERNSVNEKIAAHKKSLLARASSIASVSDEVIRQGEDGVFSINENLETRGVFQDDSLRQLVDSVLKN